MQPRSSRFILAALAATMLLAIGVNGASARNLQVNEKDFELIWSDLLGAPKTKLELILRSTGLNIQCRVTMLGRFNERTIKKETAADQGTINHTEIAVCEGGSATIVNETTPWGIRYVGFTGTLPHISSLTLALIRATFRLREPSGLECEFATEVNHPMKFILGNSTEAAETELERTGEAENATAERNARIPLRGEGFLCAVGGEEEFGGISLIRNLPRTAKIRITLI